MKRQSNNYFGCMLLIAGLFALSWAIETTARHWEFVLGIFLAAVFVVTALRLLFRKAARKKDGHDRHVKLPPEFRCKDETVIRSAEYLDALLALSAEFNNARHLSKEKYVLAIGKDGEAQTLFLMEAMGKAAVYWNVGVRLDATRCEYDILAISPYGVLHVEVKNYGGEYGAPKGVSVYRPNKWEKTYRDAAVKQSRSPFYQASHAGKTLSGVLLDACGESLPVLSVIVFPNPSFALRHVMDDRVVHCDLESFALLYNDFLTGRLPTMQERKTASMAKAVSYLANGGQFPVFFAETLTRGGQS